MISLQGHITPHAFGLILPPHWLVLSRVLSRILLLLSLRSSTGVLPWDGWYRYFTGRLRALCRRGSSMPMPVPMPMPPTPPTVPPKAWWPTTLEPERLRRSREEEVLGSHRLPLRLFTRGTRPLDSTPLEGAVWGGLTGFGLRLRGCGWYGLLTSSFTAT